MGNLSQNQKLKQLQQENKSLKKELEKYKSDNGEEKQTDGDQSVEFDTSVFKTVKSLRSAIGDIEDPDLLHDMLEYEQNNDNRKSAVKALDGRINAVNEVAQPDEDEGEPDQSDTPPSDKDENPDEETGENAES